MIIPRYTKDYHDVFATKEDTFTSYDGRAVMCLDEEEKELMICFNRNSQHDIEILMIDREGFIVQAESFPGKVYDNLYHDSRRSVIEYLINNAGSILGNFSSENQEAFDLNASPSKYQIIADIVFYLSQAKVEDDISKQKIFIPVTVGETANTVSTDCQDRDGNTVHIAVLKYSIRPKITINGVSPAFEFENWDRETDILKYKYRLNQAIYAAYHELNPYQGSILQTNVTVYDKFLNKAIFLLTNMYIY